MTTRTLGTASTTTLTAIAFSHSPLSNLGTGSSPSTTGPADMASIKNLIKDDLNALSVSPNSFIDFNGLLMIPRRGLVRVLVGDVIGVDASGWPILLSKAAAANANWVLSGSPLS